MVIRYDFKENGRRPYLLLLQASRLAGTSDND